MPRAAKPKAPDLFRYPGCAPKPYPKDLSDAIDRALVLTRSLRADVIVLELDR